MLPSPVVGQDLVGRVLEADGQRGVDAALIRLIEGERDVEAVAVSDSTGAYRLSTPGSGRIPHYGGSVRLCSAPL